MPKPSNPSQKPPKGTTVVDPSHPLGANLVFAVTFDEGGGEPSSKGQVVEVGTRTNGPTWVAKSSGTGMNFVSTSTQYVSFPKFSKLDRSGTFSFSWFFLINLTSAANFYAMVGGSASGGQELRIDQTTSKITSLVQGVASIATSTNTVTAGRTTAIGWSHDNAGAVPPGSAFYIDGVAANTPTGGQRAFVAPTSLQIGGFTSEAFNGDIYAAYYYDGVLSQPMFQWLQAEPYAMFRPVTRRSIFVVTAPPGGGGGGLATGSRLVSPADSFILQGTMT